MTQPRSWYYAAGNSRQGPVDEATARALIQDGTITPATLVWTQGMDNWKPAASTALMDGPPPLVSDPASPPITTAPPPRPAGLLMAQIALICSCLGLLGIFCCGTAPLALVGIVLGHIGQASSLASHDVRGLNRAALVIGYITLGFYLVGIVLFFVLGQSMWILEWLKSARPGWPV